MILNLIDIVSAVVQDLDRILSEPIRIADACHAWVRLVAEECLHTDKV